MPFHLCLTQSPLTVVLARFKIPYPVPLAATSGVRAPQVAMEEDTGDRCAANTGTRCGCSLEDQRWGDGAFRGHPSGRDHRGQPALSTFHCIATRCRQEFVLLSGKCLCPLVDGETGEMQGVTLGRRQVGEQLGTEPQPCGLAALRGTASPYVVRQQ